MIEDNVIVTSNITKKYKLYSNLTDRIKEAFHPLKKRYYHPFNALTDISLEIKKGETVGIIGRNGSGKSTFLQIICGILQPTSGEVNVDGRISALLELGAGFNPEFTGRQNVYINAAILGLSKEEIDERFQKITEFAAIGDFIDQPVKSYSSGMYVRLAFSVAINVDPDILVIDEALSVGDALFQAKCFSKFREFQKRGITIIFVTHSLDLITRYCSSAYLLENGILHVSGNPKEVVDEYNRMIVNCSAIGSNGVKEICDESDNSKIADFEKPLKNNQTENRYGTGKAKIIEAGIYDASGQPAQVLMHSHFYDIKIKAKFFDTIENPILAFTIKDIKGFDISGTNTLYKNINTGVVHKGDILTARFKQKMVLNPGEYILSLGCTGFEDGEYIVYERRYDYMSFDVISDCKSVGFLDLDSNVTIIKEIKD